MKTPGAFSPDAASAGKRALRTAALWLLKHIDNGTRAASLFAGADNMTESQAALACLIEGGRGTREISAFHQRWRENRLVIDKWFMVQVAHAGPDEAATVAERLIATS